MTWEYDPDEFDREILAERQPYFGPSRMTPRTANQNTPKEDLAPCGTTTAARRHRRNGEPVDALCRKADADAIRWRRSEKKRLTSTR